MEQPVHTTPFTPAAPSQALRCARPACSPAARDSDGDLASPRLRWRPCENSRRPRLRCHHSECPPSTIPRTRGRPPMMITSTVIPRATTAAPMRSLAPPRRPIVPIRFLLRPLSALSARRHPLSLTMRSTRRFGRRSLALRASSCGTGATCRHTRPSSSSSSLPRASPSSAPSSPRIRASRCRAAASPTSRTRYTASSWPSMCPRR